MFQSCYEGWYFLDLIVTEVELDCISESKYFRRKLIEGVVIEGDYFVKIVQLKLRQFFNLPKGESQRERSVVVLFYIP